MANENAGLEIPEIENGDYFDFDELEAKLQNDLDSQLSELEFLKEDREKIGNPENLGNTVMSVVWEQFLNQMATTAGEDFIKENRGLTLDLRNEAHVQTTENFADGKIATHNNEIDYQKRYDDWQDNFQRNEDGTIKTKPNRINGSEQAVLKKVARKPFDENRDRGSAAVNKDHVVPAAEIIRDPKTNAHLEKQEQINFANSSKNLKDVDGPANASKGDNKTSEWLDSERNGQKPAERFNIDEEKMREDDRVAHEEYEKLKEEGEQKSIKAGKQSQKAEAFKIGGKALRTVVMTLLAELIKGIIKKLISWLKTAKKNIESLLSSVKSAINAFISNLKKHLINAGNALATTIATAIFGPVVRVVRKAITMIKQGWKSLKEAVAYIKNPNNKHKPVGILILEVGKIVIAGLSAVGAIALGGVIETGLMSIPVFAFPIPILGSLASLVGLFIGALVAGIIGAIAISIIDKAVAKRQMNEAIKKEIIKGNEILKTQKKDIISNEVKLEQTKNVAVSKISIRHQAAANATKEALSNIFCEDRENDSVVSGNETAFEDLFEKLNKISE